MSRRTEQVNELLREEISDVLRQVQDPRILGLVTITRVDVAPDLRHASAFVSVLGSAEERDSTMRALDHARGFVRRELGRRVRLKYTPEIDFRRDRSLEEGQAVTDLMRKTAEERGETL